MTAKPPEKILVIKLGALGDFFQALGPMKAIRAHHPQAHITLLTTKLFENFARKSGYFDEIVLDKKPKWHQPKEWLALKSKLNNAHYTRVYDLQNNDRTSFYFRLFKPKPEWVGVAKGASHRNNSPERTAGQAIEGHRQTLQLAGIDNVEIDTLEWVQGDIGRFELQKPYIVFAAGSAPERPEKRWPAEHYGQIAMALQKKGYNIVLIGTIAEARVNQIIKTLCPGILDLTARTSLADIICLARGAVAAIGNDTGPMHIMGPTACPCLVLFSRHSNARRHAPIGDNVQVLETGDMEDLDIDRVLQEILQILPDEKAVSYSESGTPG
ncbi:MAG: glycosyltransferase family 9 protein [Alphaproteobacteria bacterium]